MRLIFKPFLIFLTVTLPQILILCIFYKIFEIINSQLTAWNLEVWKGFGGILGVMILASTLYAFGMIIVKKEVVPFWGLIMFGMYIPFLYGFFVAQSSIIPSQIPSWMIYDLDTTIVVFTLLMPVFVHAMLMTVFWLYPKNEDHRIGRDIAFAMGIPGAWYFLFTIAVPFLSFQSSEIFTHIIGQPNSFRTKNEYFREDIFRGRE